MKPVSYLKQERKCLNLKETKKMYINNLECRACGQSLEMQGHILNECTSLHTDDSTKVTPEQLFTEDTTTLKTTLNKIQKIMKKLEEVDTQINRGGEPSNNGRGILADLGHRTLN